MKIVVCVKQVPDTTAKKELSDDFRLKRAGVEAVLNPFDEYAIEEAIRQKEAHGGEVAMLTMGPPAAEETMRKGLAMGVDSGALVTDDALGGSDIWVTANMLATALKKMSFDLVLCGQESADSRTGLLPGALAENLGVPLLSYAEHLEIKDGVAAIHRETASGYQVVTASLPVVVMVVKAINEPRYPSLKGIMASKRKEMARMSVTDLGLDGSAVGSSGSLTHVVAATPRPEKASGRKVNESSTDSARIIADYLFENKVVA